MLIEKLSTKSLLAQLKMQHYYKSETLSGRLQRSKIKEQLSIHFEGASEKERC